MEQDTEVIRPTICTRVSFVLKFSQFYNSFTHIKILKFQHVSVLIRPSSGTLSSLAKVTTMYYFSRYTYIGTVEACVTKWLK